MSITILQNDILTAKINAKGAELQSLQQSNGLEYMWNGDPLVWSKHSPVLFPIVGTLKNDAYFFKGKEYKLPRHGFARDKVFDVEKISESEVVFVLKQNEDTLAVYPFLFCLQLRYKLSGNTLSCTYEVINTGTDNLYFSIGGHPAFAVPLLSTDDYTDYFLQFNQKEKLISHKLQNGLIGDTTEEIYAPEGKLQLAPSLFYADALVIKQPKSNIINLESNKHSNGLSFQFDGFSFLGLWAAKNARFVCVEPWCGIADSTTHNAQLTEKEGIVVLQKEEEWLRTWSVSCF